MKAKATETARTGPPVLAEQDDLAAMIAFMRQSELQVSGVPAPAVVAMIRMLRLAGRIRQQQVTVSIDLSIQIGDLDILYLLQRSTQDQRLRITDLANVLTVTPGGISKRVDRLERDGLVVREGDEGDRRASYIVPTDDGLALATRARQLSRTKLSTALSADQWSSLDVMLQALLRALDHR